MLGANKRYIHFLPNPRAPQVTADNLEKECLEVDVKGLNDYLRAEAKGAGLERWINPGGWRKAPNWNVFWWPRAKALKLVDAYMDTNEWKLRVEFAKQNKVTNDEFAAEYAHTIRRCKELRAVARQAAEAASQLQLPLLAKP